MKMVFKDTTDLQKDWFINTLKQQVHKNNMKYEN